METKRRKAIGRVTLTLLFAMLFVLLFTGCKDTGERISLDEALMQQEMFSQEDAFSRETISGEDAAEQESKQSAQQITESVWIHICGEVAVPGVYELEAGSRVYDALTAAGGFTEQADTDFYNLALEVTDGMQIVVPGVQETHSGMPEPSGSQTDGKVNLNTATSEMLQSLPGIGESRARDIIVYREQHGGFKSTEQIMEVSGIKNAVYEKIKDLVTVGK